MLEIAAKQSAASLRAEVASSTGLITRYVRLRPLDIYFVDSFNYYLLQCGIHNSLNEKNIYQPYCIVLNLHS